MPKERFVENNVTILTCLERSDSCPTEKKTLNLLKRRHNSSKEYVEINDFVEEENHHNSKPSEPMNHHDVIPFPGFMEDVLKHQFSSFLPTDLEYEENLNFQFNSPEKQYENRNEFQCLFPQYDFSDIQRGFQFFQTSKSTNRKTSPVFHVSENLFQQYSQQWKMLNLQDKLYWILQAKLMDSFLITNPSQNHHQNESHNQKVVSQFL